MKKKWYDDAEIVYSSRGDKLDSVRVSIPNSQSETDYKEVLFVGGNLDNQGLLWLIRLLDSALTELSKRSKEGNQ